MGRKRDRVEIIADMLSAVQGKGGEIKPTHLMYKSNLSHTQMTGYLDDLVEKQFIKRTKRPKGEYIIITDRGHQFLEKWREMKAFDEAFGLE